MDDGEERTKREGMEIDGEKKRRREGEQKGERRDERVGRVLALAKRE